MPTFTVSFRFTDSPQGDVHTYRNIEAPSKQEAIKIATEHLEDQFPTEAKSPYKVNCEQDH
jgi:hypothetical protein